MTITAPQPRAIEAAGVERGEKAGGRNLMQRSSAGADIDIGDACIQVPHALAGRVRIHKEVRACRNARGTEEDRGIKNQCRKCGSNKVAAGVPDALLSQLLRQRPLMRRCFNPKSLAQALRLLSGKNANLACSAEISSKDVEKASLGGL